MLAFLPVSRFRVTYQVATGRPYSPLERYLLEAVQEGYATLDALVDLFRVHRRIVIEGLVTLMQAGWIGLQPGGDDKFDMTDAGREALKQSGALPPNIVLTEKTAFLVMEQLRGQIAPSNAVTFWERRKLDTLWPQGVRIPKTDATHMPEPGQVRPMLRTKAVNAEYVRATGPIEFDRHNSDYLVVDVDTANRRLVGIPSEWEAELIDDLVERVQQREADLIAEGQSLDDGDLRKLVRITRDDKEGTPVPDVWRVPADTIQFINGTEAHSRLLSDCLRRASSCVVVSSAVLTRIGVADLLRDIGDAVQRGVLIDVLWGWPPDSAQAQEHAAALSMLRGIEENTRSMVKGRLQVAVEPCRSNMGVLISDPDGAFEVTLGCCHWLAGKKGANALSVQLTHAEVVSRLCGLIADLLGADRHLEMSASAMLLHSASAELDAQSLGLGAKVPQGTFGKEYIEARLLLDRQHELYCRLASAKAREHLILSSRRWEIAEPDILPGIRDALENGCRQADIFYSVGSPSVESVGDELRKLGARVSAGSDLPNYAVVDDQVFVSSRDWLARPRAGARPRLSDIGISLQSPDVVNRLMASLNPVSER